MKRIAIGTWQGCVSATLDFAGSLLLVETIDGERATQREVGFQGGPPQAIAARLQQLGVDVVICGAISRCLARDLSTRGIRVIPFVSGKADEVLQAFANGTLEGDQFRMAGCVPETHGAGRRCRRRGNPGQA